DAVVICTPTDTHADLIERFARAGKAECVIARANHRVSYPAKFQLIAAMNPCRFGIAGEPGHSCARGPRCMSDYQARISG
ncbi:ATP-binding protein, partial [Rhizobium ruizarguesonis]